MMGYGAKFQFFVLLLHLLLLSQLCVQQEANRRATNREQEQVHEQA